VIGAEIYSYGEIAYSLSFPLVGNYLAMIKWIQHNKITILPTMAGPDIVHLAT